MSSASNNGLTQPPVHLFGNGKGTVGEAGASIKWLLGGKGANLAEMAKIGLAVPAGFTLTTEVCDLYSKNDLKLPDFVWTEAVESVKHIEEAMGSKLGDGTNPLLLSVRSGAAISMPGMMDTVLNLGLNDTTVKALATKTGNERFAFDSYRRFLDMFGDVVLGIPHEAFEHELGALKKATGVEHDTDLGTEKLQELVETYKGVYTKHGHTFPTDPQEQLRKSICAVFDSWQSPRAKKYMEVQNITGLLGTAVNVQAMVFGNMGETSCTGVLFTRSPNTGENQLFGEFLVNAQGEDVVAGIRTPKPIADLKTENPTIYEAILRNCAILEKHFKDMQDVEFTVQEAKLFMLQTRNGKRGGKAAVQIAVDMANEGIITQADAINLVTPEHLDIMLHPQFEDEKAESYKSSVLGTGLPASPGAAVGTVCFNTADVEALHVAGGKPILVRDETSPEDVGGMYAAAGILTARGGMTSHAAVVARGWGKTCICGLGELRINEAEKTATIGTTVLKEGDLISLNGTTGELLLGKQPMAAPEISGSLGTFMGWVDAHKTMSVLANADSPADAAEARRNGASGIGLCRTEHMFFDHLAEVRRMILAPTDEARRAALAEILPLQRIRFDGIFEAMDGLPVTIRTLDPPLHEFVPEEADQALADSVGLTLEQCAHAIEKLGEHNPMLGLRGCRLGIVSPEIIEMQARAIIEAALDVKARGKNPIPQIMIPLIGTVAEFKHQEQIIRSTVAKVFEERKCEVEYHVGTMIEVPRAALLSGPIAEAGAEFFSFGTNDLTQMTFGYSRDDVGGFLPQYIEAGILKHDPFQYIDEDGVGMLVKMSTDAGRKFNAKLKAGVCGEHGGEPASVKFFHGLGHDYVSCSAFRVPIARLAAAQAAIASAGKK